MLGSAQYPSLEQSNKDGNEKYETPKNMVGRSLPVRFGYSIFGRPGNATLYEGAECLADAALFQRDWKTFMRTSTTRRAWRDLVRSSAAA